MRYLIGIQPTGNKLHIGHYLGCISSGIEKIKKGHDVTFMIADLHAQTTISDYSIISKNTQLLIQELKLLGIPSDNIKIQGCNSYILPLFFELCTKVNLGTLTRMPQYKDKKEASIYDFGLLTYPLLMAADVYSFDPDIILVGEDQIAHIELLNDLSQRVNIVKKYEYELTSNSKILSLMDPNKKMSKSLGDKHCLYLNDNFSSKILKANTNELGIANLKSIATGLGFNESFNSNLEFKHYLIENLQEKFKTLNEIND
jgi:tryptophanyl-tRNA synthetase